MKKNIAFTITLFLVCCNSMFLHAQVTHRDILSRISYEAVEQNLIEKKQWKPFPKNLAEWQQYLPDTMIRKIVADAETAMTIPCSSISASIILEYVRQGDRDTYQQLSFARRQRLFNLVLAESMENKGRFADAIADGVWSICEETYWGVPAHLFAQKAGSGLPDVEDPTVDLFASETAAVLALTDYLAGAAMDKVSPLLRKRIYAEVNRRILLPLETSADRYRHLGARGKNTAVNNWNPWIISNWMTALLLLENDPQRRAKELHHSLGLLDLYVNGLGEDGAADEGPEYWFAAGAALFDALTLFSNATAEKIPVLQDPFFGRIASYIYKTYIGSGYFINVADAHPHINADGMLMYRFGKAVNDNTLQRFGSWAFRHADESVDGPKRFYRTRTLFNLLALREMAGIPAEEPHPDTVWLGSIQLMASRTKNGLFLSAHGGHNGGSHNNNDVGDFIVYAGNRPVIIDAGSGTYTSASFSSSRYELWYNTSSCHNLPTINRQQQGAGADFKARSVSYKRGERTDVFMLDMADAFPKAAGIDAWTRNIMIDKQAGKIRIQDRYEFSKSNDLLTQTFMTVCSTDISKPGVIVFDTGERKVTLRYDAKDWRITKEEIQLDKPDEKGLADGWRQTVLYRLLLTNISNKRAGIFTYTIE